MLSFEKYKLKLWINYKIAGVWTFQFPTLRLSKHWPRHNVILNNVVGLCKGINGSVLSVSILGLIVSVKIKDTNTYAIWACIAELMIRNAQKLSEIPIKSKYI